MRRVLFILKYRETDYTDITPQKSWAHSRFLSSGLYNSARFVSNMINSDITGVESKLVHVTDNNDIDREVAKYKPTHVIIEAYWVVPEKFDVLIRLHPHVKWIIRNHSNVPFLSNEGIAFGWTIDYLKYPNVYVSSNHPKAVEDLRSLLRHVYPNMSPKELKHRTPYLPNYYPLVPAYAPHKTPNETLDIGCFGAIRPLKNQTMQALAAIKFALKEDKHLRFHINGNRLEGNGEPILKNIREIFKRTDFELVEHPWLEHENFIKLVCQMDLGLQVSFSETFNIVAADFAVNNIPIVTSSEIDWSAKHFQADPTDLSSIVRAMNAACCLKKFDPWLNPNIGGLKKYDAMSIEEWKKVLLHT